MLTRVSSNGFAVCTGCSREMSPGGAEGCAVASVLLPSGTHARVALGSESPDWWLGRPPDAECHDCSVASGQLHHVSCDMEQCPVCRDQLLTCDCID